uniref:Uncharacterized protein n=1 Tax=Anopheles melas TaxID=34690 RepID=A0A182TGH8_9DIPT
MATRCDKRSGMVYHARDRLLKRRLQEWEEECARASLPQSTAMENLPSSMSDSDEEGAMSYSSGADTDTDDGLLHEVPQQDCPFGEAWFEDDLRLWALQTSQTHRALALLLVHIRQHQPHCKLSCDPRTLMHTPVSKSTEAEITSIGERKSVVQRCGHMFAVILSVSVVKSLSFSLRSMNCSVFSLVCMFDLILAMRNLQSRVLRSTFL